MIQEIYPSRKQSQKYISPAKIRQMKKKALQSYSKIDSIKKASSKEAKETANDAEKLLDESL